MRKSALDVFADTERAGRLVASRLSVLELLDRVAYGVSVSIAQAAEYGMRHADARSFADRLIETLTRGLGRLGLKPISAHALDRDPVST